MGRWTQYDEDSYRLPEGVTRTGYDADTSQYSFNGTSSGSPARYCIVSPSAERSNTQYLKYPREPLELPILPPDFTLESAGADSAPRFTSINVPNAVRALRRLMLAPFSRRHSTEQPAQASTGSADSNSVTTVESKSTFLRTPSHAGFIFTEEPQNSETSARSGVDRSGSVTSSVTHHTYSPTLKEKSRASTLLLRTSREDGDISHTRHLSHVSSDREKRPYPSALGQTAILKEKAYTSQTSTRSSSLNKVSTDKTIRTSDAASEHRARPFIKPTERTAENSVTPSATTLTTKKPGAPSLSVRTPSQISRTEQRDSVTREPSEIKKISRSFTLPTSSTKPVPKPHTSPSVLPLSRSTQKELRSSQSPAHVIAKEKLSTESLSRAASAIADLPSRASGKSSDASPLSRTMSYALSERPLTSTPPSPSHSQVVAAARRDEVFSNPRPVPLLSHKPKPVR